MGTNPPRAVMVYRASEYDALIARHATHAQADFFLSSRGQDIDAVRKRHDTLYAAFKTVSESIPSTWRNTRVQRKDLDRFAFNPDDIVLVIGQDGLVANTAKYLEGQPVIGINPDPAMNDGILVPHAPQRTAELLKQVSEGRAHIQQRTMVTAKLDDGQSITALNELFIGVKSHQSARYQIKFCGTTERQSSSGVIVSTGTGATGWARSIAGQRRDTIKMPKPEDRALVFFTREAFPSVTTGTGLVQGTIQENTQLHIVSEINRGGVIFGDGIESDFLTFDWGQEVRIQAGTHACQLVVAAKK